MEYYDEASLAVVKRGAMSLIVKLKRSRSFEIALRSRGTPRIADRLLVTCT